MLPPNPLSIATHFESLADPRISGKTEHKLLDIIVIAISGVICHADDWVSIAQFGRAKEGWFRQFLELPNGIPSHDTFNRVFSRLSPTGFQACFASWVRALSGAYDGLIAVDGKRLRGSYDRASDKSAIHLVSAWAVDNALVLGQVKTNEKSNEITAIPQLLNLLALEGCLVTIDAMGCQKPIARQIIDQGGDYVLAVKGNQRGLYEQVLTAFETAENAEFKGYTVDTLKTQDQGHGRTEVRRYCVLATEGLLEAPNWVGLNMIGVVEAERTEHGKTRSEMRYYIGSIPPRAADFARAVRGHWHIENSLHWVLDVAFREDDCRVRKGYGAENLAVLRHIALNAAKQEKTAKLGVKNKRLRAGWDEPYLAKILAGI
ncbi:MAG: ISAs1 family transposase [Gammaproteobacteria bacterium]